jgi:hypothetical protein
MTQHELLVKIAEHTRMTRFYVGFLAFVVLIGTIGSVMLIAANNVRP